jgi:hypothetical protein
LTDKLKLTIIGVILAILLLSLTAFLMGDSFQWRDITTKFYKKSYEKLNDRYLIAILFKISLIWGGGVMADIYVLASIPDQGKTTTAILLEKYFQNKGLKVACLQNEKGPFDVHTYLENGCYHYTIPLEAAKNKKSFEQWLPKGYDNYILEITCPYSPIGAAFVDLFENVNELISYNLKDSWTEFVFSQMHNDWRQGNHTNSNFSELIDHFYKRNVNKVLTKTPGKTDVLSSVDNSFVIHHPEQFVSNIVNPENTFPKSQQTAIAVGIFPAEYWDICPDLHWYNFDYAAFMEMFRKGDYDLAVIGVCGTENMKFAGKPEHDGKVICYQPSVYLEGSMKVSHDNYPVVDDLLSVYRIIKNEPVGTPIGKDGGCFAQYNNRYWLFNPNKPADLVLKDKNTVFCHGWVLPQYLIRDGYLEMS